MQFTLVLSVGLVVMVVLLFLRSFRATIIAGVALPVSLIATFGVMYFCGFSVDNLSLMALTIGTGFVVDDAIVMIENIVRHLEKGEKPMKAALDGAREIGFTVISLTMSLIAVFIPLLFMTGLVGRMFREFALTLTIAVVVSAVVSLTLTPMMCSRLLSAGGHEGGGRLGQLFGRFMDSVIRGYGRSLEFVLRHQPATLFVFAGHGRRHDLALRHHAEGLPSGSGHRRHHGGHRRRTADLVCRNDPSAEARWRQSSRTIADVSGVASIVGIGQLNATQNVGSLKIMLKPRSKRQSNVLQIIDRLKGEVASVAGTTVHSSRCRMCRYRRRRAVRATSTRWRVPTLPRSPSGRSAWPTR